MPFCESSNHSKKSVTHRNNNVLCSSLCARGKYLRIDYNEWILISIVGSLDDRCTSLRYFSKNQLRYEATRASRNYREHLRIERDVTLETPPSPTHIATFKSFLSAPPWISLLLVFFFCLCSATNRPRKQQGRRRSLYTGTHMKSNLPNLRFGIYNSSFNVEHIGIPE